MTSLVTGASKPQEDRSHEGTGVSPSRGGCGVSGAFPSHHSWWGSDRHFCIQAGRRSGEHCVLTGPLYQDTSSFLQSSPRTSVRPELCHKVVSSCMGGWESDYVVGEGKGSGGLGPSPGLATLGGRVSLRHHSSVP